MCFDGVTGLKIYIYTYILLVFALLFTQFAVMIGFSTIISICFMNCFISNPQSMGGRAMLQCSLTYNFLSHIILLIIVITAIS